MRSNWFSKLERQRTERKERKRIQVFLLRTPATPLSIETLPPSCLKPRLPWVTNTERILMFFCFNPVSLGQNWQFSFCLIISLCVFFSLFQIEWSFVLFCFGRCRVSEELNLCLVDMCFFRFFFVPFFFVFCLTAKKKKKKKKKKQVVLQRMERGKNRFFLFVCWFFFLNDYYYDYFSLFLVYFCFNFLFSIGISRPITLYYLINLDIVLGIFWKFFENTIIEMFALALV